MNGLDVRALGWVVTRDLLSEMVQVAFGGRRRIPSIAFRELGDRWRAVHAPPSPDRAGPLPALLGRRLTTSLSRQSEEAVIELVASLQACSPELYSEQALRHRGFNAVRQAIASFALGAIAAHWASPDIPIIADSAFVLFAIACWSLVTTIQLWRTYHLVKRMNRCRGMRAPSRPERLARIRGDRDGPRTIETENHRPSNG